jgi:hypothetical protein
MMSGGDTAAVPLARRGAGIPHPDVPRGDASIRRAGGEATSQGFKLIAETYGPVEIVEQELSVAEAEVERWVQSACVLCSNEQPFAGMRLRSATRGCRWVPVLKATTFGGRNDPCRRRRRAVTAAWMDRGRRSATARPGRRQHPRRGHERAPRPDRGRHQVQGPG